MNTEIRPIVVKIGGSTLGAHDTSLADCASLHAQGEAIVVVHGGGATVSSWLERLQVPSEFVDGLRKTTEASREVVVAVLAGLVNKQLVQQLSALGVRAVGLSGVDGATLRSAMNSRGLGFVGETPVCDPSTLRALLAEGALPVVAPIGLSTDAGDLININADTAAGAISEALHARHLIFLTDVAGILDEGESVLPALDGAQADGLRESGTLSGGMLPKVEACLTAAGQGTQARIVDGREPGAVVAALAGTLGTLVG